MTVQTGSEQDRALTRLSLLIQGRSIALDACLHEFRQCLRKGTSWPQCLDLLAQAETLSDECEFAERELLNSILMQLQASPRAHEPDFQMLIERLRKQHSWELILQQMATLVRLAVGQGVGETSLQAPSDSAVDLDRLRGKLSLLLDSLRSYTSAYEKIDELAKQLDVSNSQANLEEVLLGLSAFIAKLFSAEQQEFESYLDTLNHCLEEIKAAVNHSRQIHSELDLSADELHDSINASMQTLEGHVGRATTLDELKHQVKTNLSVITAAMGQFQEQEAIKRLQMTEEMQHLDDRIQRMAEENLRVQKELESSKRQALTDRLTNLPNRLAYDHRIEAMMHEHPEGLAMAVGDIDRFKYINDTFGHQAGDKLLQIVARLMMASMRSSDFLCRFGGEEFVLLLPLTRIEDAEKVLQKLRRRISNTRLHFRGQPLSVTISFGLTLARSGDDADSLFARADEAMYKAKNLGRDQVAIL